MSARRFREAFAVQLVHRLRDQDPRITPALTWLDQRLAIQDTTADAVVRDVHRRQGAANVTVRNIITSMRLISDVDWQQLFERLSLVDAVFAADSPLRGYGFPDAHALPQRGRGTGARLEAHGAGYRRRRGARGESRAACGRQRPSKRGAAIPAIICLRGAAAPLKRPSLIARRCETGWRGSTGRLASAAM